MLTVAEVAVLLGIRRQRVIQLIKKGELIGELQPANQGGRPFYLVTTESVIKRKKAMKGKWEKLRHDSDED